MKVGAVVLHYRYWPGIRTVEVGGQLQALAGPLGGGAGRGGRLQIAVLAAGDEQRSGGPYLVEVALEPGVEAEQGIGRLQDGAPGWRGGLDRLEGGHHAPGRPGRSGRRGGDRPGDPDVAADQREGAELAQGPLVEPLLGADRILLGLLDELETLFELARLEAAGAGEQGPWQRSGPPRPASLCPWPARSRLLRRPRAGRTAAQ